AADRRGALAGARAVALAADLLARDGDGLDAARVRLAQVQLQGVEQILAGLRAVPPPRAAPAEQPAEEVPEQVEDRAVTEVGHGHAFEPGVAVAVVAAALVGVAEDRVGFGDLLEAGGGLLVTRVPVRVVLHGQAAVRLLDLLRAGALRDAE